MKNTIIALIVIIILAALGWFFFGRSSTTEITNSIEDATEEVMTDTDTTDGESMTDSDSDGEMMEEGDDILKLGESANGNDIESYDFGDGDTKLLFVGGIHGGYSWNTSLVAFELIDYLTENPDAVPANVTVTVVPVMNPDGLQAVTGKAGRFVASDVSGDTVPGRFNGNGVDLNRNFDCDWQSEGVWQNQAVDGGSAAFSEPEAVAIRDYVNRHNPDAVVVWYSSAGGVFASNCHQGVLPETNTILNTYAAASGYQAFAEFDFYEVTGDMTNWLAKQGIPAISVLLSDHTGTEWSKNKAGIDALLDHYAG